MTQLELPFETESENNITSDQKKEARYYIIRLDSYYGEHSSLTCSADDVDYMFSVLVIHDNNASIIDYGYSTIEQLLEAWNNVTFQNIASFVEN